ncbi:WXG100 family type VII secretion target [Haloglycomyces albus]|uniref:WXG100 family type VII secretion target n=1 Tax=Haloglycomyces albus TaxID=526067 RepID=UPI00046CE82D|nr:hypothetical protein [Haloglycomyces albus]
MSENPLVASADEKDGIDGTGFGLWEDYTGVRDAISDGTWIDVTLAGVGAALDAGSLAIDPIGTLASMGISWLMEQVEPLSEILDWLTGDPDLVGSHAQTWSNVANELYLIGESLQTSVDSGASAWNGEGSDGYKEMQSFNVEYAGLLGAMAETLKEATEGAGTLVQITRELVRDLIADAVATLMIRVPEWLLEISVTVGVGTGWVIGKVVALVVKWVGTAFGFVSALISSIQALSKIMG